jgi:hypothetical protein
LRATVKFSSKIKPCSGRNTHLLYAKNPFELEALSLFELGLSCWQICLAGSGSTIAGRGEKRTGTMYRAPTGKTKSTLEMKVESRRARVGVLARVAERKKDAGLKPGAT